MAIIQFPQSSGNLWDMIPNQLKHYQTTSSSINAGSFIDIITVSGKGVLGPFYSVIHSPALGLCAVIDGTEHQIYVLEAGANNARGPRMVGDSYYVSSDAATLIHSEGLYRFNTEFRIRIRNVHSSSQISYAAGSAIGGIYYT